ncbi:ATP-dependent DNA helicase [Nanoarchaeota archaeon]
MRDLFPYSEVRKEQDKLLEDVKKSLLAGENLLVQAPTGLGKTASTLPAALALALEKGLKVFFLTNRHTQHKIAIETLREIKEKHEVDFLSVDIVGKQWMCSQPHVSLLYSGEFNLYCKEARENGKCGFYERMKTQNKLSVKARKLIEDLGKAGPLNTEELKKRCQEQELCSYYIAMELAKSAQVVIADYYYLFNPAVQQNFFSRLGLELDECILIIDEGHNLPGRVRDLMTSKLTNFMLKNAIKEAKKFEYGEVVSLLSGLQDVLLGLNLDDIEEVVIDKEKFVDRVDRIKDYKDLLDDLEVTAAEIREKQNRSFLGGVIGFLERWVGADDGFVRYVTERETKNGTLIALSYSCLDPSIITKSIFEQVHSSIVMSGTLVPTKMFKDVLGIKGEEKSYSSPFPDENRLSLVVPSVSTKYTLRNDEMYQRIAEICVDIIKKVPGNCALFFPSYVLRNSVFKFFGDCGKKIILEKSDLTKEEKEDMIEDFKSSKDEGAVLLGVAAANFSEGIDLPGDFLKCVMVVGLPLAKPDLLTKKLISYYEEKFSKGWDYGYTYPAINKVLQAAGRCIRSETDKGVVVFLDFRFTWPNYACCLEGWDLKIDENYVDLIGNFFEN